MTLRIEKRREHRESTRRARALEIKKKEDPDKPCALTSCVRPAGAIGRFCRVHTKERSVYGTADPKDRLPEAVAVLAKSAFRSFLCTAGCDLRERAKGLFAKMVASDLPEMTIDEFNTERTSLKRATQAAYLWRDLSRLDAFDEVDAVVTVGAYRWAYLILHNYGLVGQDTNGWTVFDHQHAYEIAAGRHFTKCQALYPKAPPGTVLSEMVQNVGTGVLEHMMLASVEDQTFYDQLAMFPECHQAIPQIAALFAEHTGRTPKKEIVSNG